MKKLYLLLLAIAMVPFMGNAQFSEDFQGVDTSNGGVGPLPSGWVTYDQDGNTPNVPLPNAWDVVTFDGVNKLAASTSSYSPAGQSDDWMVTPQITVPATSPFLIFEEWNTDPSAPGEYEVLISTTGNTPADFTTVIHTENNPSNTGLQPVAIDLASYAGQQVYIAFRNITNAGYLLGIDNVEVLSLSSDNLAIVSLELPNYGLIGANTTLDVTIMNLGGNVINTADVEWSDGTNNYVHSLSNLNLQPYASTTITHSTALNYANIVENTITVTASGINGNTDTDPSDNTMTTSFQTISQAGTKHVVIEEGTGTWCQYCPRGFVAMEHMYNNPTLFPNFIGIAVHASYSSTAGIDPMQVDNYIAGASFTGFPGSNVDREILDAPVNKDIWVNFYNTRKDIITPADVSLTASYDAATREITANVSADFYTTYAQADLRLSVVVVEDEVTGTTAGYAQANAYSGSGEPMGGFENLPNPVPASQMVYDRVGIALLGGYNGETGSVPTAINDGDTANYTFTYTLPNDSDWSKIALVGLLIDQNTGAILNANEVQLDGLGVVENPIAINNISMYPNPTSELINVSFGMTAPANVNLNIYSMSGALVKTQAFENLNGNQSVQVDVSTLSAGEYLVSLATEKGAVVKSIIVK